jgi:hypothetical protein
MGVRLVPDGGMVDGGMVDTDPTRPKRAMEIVRALAERASPTTEGHNGNDFCRLCYEDVLPLGQPGGEDLHASDCPWRQAREWVRS